MRGRAGKRRRAAAYALSGELLHHLGLYHDDEITWMKYGLKKENFDDERRAGKRKRAAGYALRRCMGPAGGRAGVQ